MANLDDDHDETVPFLPDVNMHDFSHRGILLDV